MAAPRSVVRRAEILGSALEYRWIRPRSEGTPAIVFLHEGLGCVSMWRDVPDRLSSATGCGALVYSRLGHGASDPICTDRSHGFMHDEALKMLPAVLDFFRLDDVILFGHSDGASIALLYAASVQSRVRALILEAPHVFIEPICLDRISKLLVEYETTPLRERLERHHGANTDSMFRTWTGVWLSAGFDRWNIEECLGGIMSPLLVIQGEDDEYGTLRQVDRVLERVAGRARSLVLPACGHSPHSQRPEEVLDAASEFVRGVVST